MPGLPGAPGLPSYPLGPGGPAGPGLPSYPVGPRLPSNCIDSNELLFELIIILMGLYLQVQLGLERREFLANHLYRDCLECLASLVCL